MRATGEVRTDGDGGVVIDILSEANYYEQQFTGRRAEPISWPAHLVWID
jgi:hypothetical protein